VYVHGFIYMKGEKLSKSLGNALDPIELAKLGGPDALRFYLIHAIPTGRDGEFTYEQFVEHCNTHLANDLGNLASRTVAMVHKYFDGTVPKEWGPATLRDEPARAALDTLVAAAGEASLAVPRAFHELRLHEAVDAAWQPVVRANELIERVKPWVLARDPERRVELATTISALLETLRIVAVWAWPVIPGKSEELWSMLNLPGKPGELRGDMALPRFGDPALADRKLAAATILFPRIELETDDAPAA
jgi:methionyl-tRNA synthetase